MVIGIYFAARRRFGQVAAGRDSTCLMAGFVPKELPLIGLPREGEEFRKFEAELKKRQEGLNYQQNRVVNDSVLQ